jgi:hypothetical protein
MEKVTAGSKKAPRPGKSAGRPETPEGTARPPRKRFIIESESATEIRRSLGITDEEAKRVEKQLIELGLL